MFNLSSWLLAPRMINLSQGYFCSTVQDLRYLCQGYSIFKGTLRGGGLEVYSFGGYLPLNSILLTPPPHLHILNSMLHLELPCATPSSHISNYLIPPTPTLQIIFQSPKIILENGIALRINKLMYFCQTLQNKFHQ